MHCPQQKLVLVGSEIFPREPDVGPHQKTGPDVGIRMSGCRTSEVYGQYFIDERNTERKKEGKNKRKKERKKESKKVRKKERKQERKKEGKEGKNRKEEEKK